MKHKDYVRYIVQGRVDHIRAELRLFEDVLGVYHKGSDAQMVQAIQKLVDHAGLGHTGRIYEMYRDMYAEEAGE